jgi:hypothetical protein
MKAITITDRDIQAYEARRRRVASFGRADLVVPDRYNKGPIDRSTAFDPGQDDWSDALEATRAQVDQAKFDQFSAAFAAGDAAEVDPKDALLADTNDWLAAEEKRLGKRH